MESEILDTISIRVSQWPSSTKAELVAIWTMLLTIPISSEAIVYTDSEAAICAIKVGFTLEPTSKAQKRPNFLLVEKIIDLIKTKDITLELNKVKGHSNNKWNDFADKLAKKGCMALEKIQVNIGENTRFQSVLYWKNWLVEAPPRAFIKTLNNMYIGAEWRQSRIASSIVQEDRYNDKSWSFFWKKLKEITGIQGTTLKKSKKACFIIKCLSENLLLLVSLNKRKPDLYEAPNCLSCNANIKEVHEHLVNCVSYETSWWSIQSVAAEVAWNNLSKDVQKRLTKQKLAQLVFGKEHEEIVSARIGLIKGLFCHKAQKRIQRHFQTNKLTNHIIEDILNIVWNSFFEIIWKDRCQIVNEWEEEAGIARKENEKRRLIVKKR